MGCTAYEISSAQKRMYLVEHFQEKSTFYNIACAEIIEGDLDRFRLQGAIRKLIQRHEMLRTSFEMENGEIVQKVYDEIDFELKFSRSSRGEIDEIIEKVIQPFDLGEVPLWNAELIQLADSRFLFIFDIHHIIADGVSTDLIFSEIIAFYQQKELPPLNFQYVDFTIWQNDLLEGKEIKKQEEYWLAQFADEIPVLNLPTDFPRAAEMAVTGAALEFELPLELAEKFNILAATHNATLFMLLLAAYSILLSKYSAQEDIVLGMPIAGRPQPELEGIVGMFVNMLALRSRPSGSKSFNVFLGEVAQNMFMAFENQDYPFEILIQKLGLKWQLNREPLFDTVFGLQSLSPYEGVVVRELANLNFIPYPIEHKAVKFDLSWTVSIVGQKIAGKVKYRTSLFKRETIERLKEHYCAILQSIARNPGLPISGIQMLSREEREYLLHTVNNTYAGYPEDRTVHWLFDRQAARTPDNTALVFEEKQLSYRELKRRANTLAEKLRERAVKPNSVVGMLVERSIEMVEGMLGILKTGGAYLPISPDYPAGRIRYMLKDSGVSILLTHRNLADNDEKIGNRFIGQEVYLDDEDLYGEYKEVAHLNMIGLPSSPVYLIYTSGTTGTPKGILVEHKNVVNVVSWFGRQYNLQPGMKVLQMSDYTFDASVNQIFGTLLHGAVLCLMNKDFVVDIEGLRRYIEVNGIHLINFVPTILAELLCSGEKLGSLRIVISGAEKLTEVTKNRILEKGYRLYNQYGPTETTIDASVLECSDGDVSLGKPISNVRCYILDRSHNLSPEGVVGELYVAGAGLARGYLNRPELTSEKFTANPFLPGELMYRTGDLVRWLPDGNIELSGRIDYQVKIRGFRIESAEIEDRLLEHEEIEAAVVLPRTDEGGSQYLCAYIVADRELAVSKLRRSLSRQLPGYMIPSHFIRLERLPLTPGGKIDREALPMPEGYRPELETLYIEPGSYMEQLVAGVWKEVLKLNKVGIHDNFFDVGGNSLAVIQAHTRLKRILKRDLSVITLYRYPTVHSFVEYLTGETAAEDSSDSPSYRADAIKEGKARLKSRIGKRHSQFLD